MDRATAQQFLATRHRAVLATRRRGGRPQLSPVTVGIDDVGRLIVWHAPAGQLLQQVVARDDSEE